MFGKATLIIVLVVSIWLFSFVLLVTPSMIAVAKDKEPSMRVAFDETHNPMVSISYNVKSRDPGAYSRLADFLKDLGFHVFPLVPSREMHGISKDLLENVDVLVIVPGDEDYTSEEIKDIISWVQSGGSLVLLGDYDHYPHNINPIARRFGFIFESDLFKNGFMNIYQPDSYTLDPVYPVFTSYMLNKSHVLLRNVNRLEMYSASTIRIINNSIDFSVLVRTSSKAKWYDTLNYVEGPSIPNKPVAIIVRYGKGLIVAIGDTNLWCNHDIDRDGTPSLYDSDNYILAKNIFQYLSRREKAMSPWIEISFTNLLLLLAVCAVFVLAVFIVWRSRSKLLQQREKK